MEEAFMMVFPERMLKGDLPNRDFLHLYGPGALHVLMGWYKVVGISLESERTFGLHPARGDHLRPVHPRSPLGTDRRGCRRRAVRCSTS